MSFFTPFSYLKNRNIILLVLMLLCSVSYSQNNADGIKDFSKNPMQKRNIEEETTSLIQENDVLQSLNRSYIFIGSILLISLAIATVFIYHLWNQRQIIKKQNVLLEQANATKNQFFSIIAHDLRGPVIAFQNLSRKLNYLNEKGQKEDVQKMFQQVDVAANNLNNLLDNLLSWSLIEENTFPYQPTSINLKELCTEICQLYLPLAKSKGIKLKQHIFADFIVIADRNSLSTIIRNLLSNAIKFSDRGDKVKILAKKIKGKVELRIEDTGKGISQDMQKKLFLLNDKKVTTGTKGEKGTGLGLVLCKNFVELNKGDIYVKSQKGKGSLFSVLLPV